MNQARLTPHSSGVDVNGVKMIYASAPSGPAYFYKLSDNIEGSKCPTHATCQSPSGFRVTGMSLDRNSDPNVSKVIYRGSCPININVPMTITTVGFGPVTWRGNGHEWHAQQVFTSPGTHSFLQPIPITHSGQEVIKIQYPTQMAIYGTIICTNK